MTATRKTRGDDGLYHIAGKTFQELEGSRAQVMHGTAYRTPGGLTRKGLRKNKRGEIVSLKKMRSAKRERRLQKAGYFTQKGKFGAVKRDSRKRGGSAVLPLTPATA